jgi:hypothetical protein
MTLLHVIMRLFSALRAKDTHERTEHLQASLGRERDGEREIWGERDEGEGERDGERERERESSVSIPYSVRL